MNERVLTALHKIATSVHIDSLSSEENKKLNAVLRRIDSKNAEDPYPGLSTVETKRIKAYAEKQDAANHTKQKPYPGLTPEETARLNAYIKKINKKTGKSSFDIKVGY